MLRSAVVDDVEFDRTLAEYLDAVDVEPAGVDVLSIVADLRRNHDLFAAGQVLRLAGHDSFETGNLVAHLISPSSTVDSVTISCPSKLSAFLRDDVLETAY